MREKEVREAETQARAIKPLDLKAYASERKKVLAGETRGISHWELAQSLGLEKIAGDSRKFADLLRKSFPSDLKYSGDPEVRISLLEDIVIHQALRVWKDKNNNSERRDQALKVACGLASCRHLDQASRAYQRTLSRFWKEREKLCDKNWPQVRKLQREKKRWKRTSYILDHLEEAVLPSDWPRRKDTRAPRVGMMPAKELLEIVQEIKAYLGEVETEAGLKRVIEKRKPLKREAVPRPLTEKLKVEGIRVDPEKLRRGDFRENVELLDQLKRGEIGVMRIYELVFLSDIASSDEPLKTFEGEVTYFLSWDPETKRGWITGGKFREKVVEFDQLLHRVGARSQPSLRYKTPEGARIGILLGLKSVSSVYKLVS